MTKNVYEEMISDFQSGAFDPLFNLIGVPNDFEPDSLERLEDIINLVWPNEPVQEMTSVIPFGFLLGETLVRHLPGAKWVTEDAKDLFDVSVEVPAGEAIQKVMPFRRVNNFFNDRTDGLAVVYRMVEMMQRQLLDPDQLTDGQWLTMPNGDQIRVTRTEKE